MGPRQRFTRSLYLLEMYAVPFDCRLPPSETSVASVKIEDTLSDYVVYLFQQLNGTPTEWKQRSFSYGQIVRIFIAVACYKGAQSRSIKLWHVDEDPMQDSQDVNILQVWKKCEVLRLTRYTAQQATIKSEFLQHIHECILNYLNRQRKHTKRMALPLDIIQLYGEWEVDSRNKECVLSPALALDTTNGQETISFKQMATIVLPLIFERLLTDYASAVLNNTGTVGSHMQAQDKHQTLLLKWIASEINEMFLTKWKRFVAQFERAPPPQVAWSVGDIEDLDKLTAFTPPCMLHARTLTPDNTSRRIITRWLVDLGLREQRDVELVKWFFLNPLNALRMRETTDWFATHRKGHMHPNSCASIIRLRSKQLVCPYASMQNPTEHCLSRARLNGSSRNPQTFTRLAYEQRPNK